MSYRIYDTGYIRYALTDENIFADPSYSPEIQSKSWRPRKSEKWIHIRRGVWKQYFTDYYYQKEEK